MVTGSDVNPDAQENRGRNTNSLLWPARGQCKSELHSHLREPADRNGPDGASTVPMNKTSLMDQHPDPNSNTVSPVATPTLPTSSLHHHHHHHETRLLHVHQQHPYSDTMKTAPADKTGLTDKRPDLSWETSSTPQLLPHQNMGMLQYPGSVWRQRQQQNRTGGPQLSKNFSSSNALPRDSADGSCGPNVLLTPPAGAPAEHCRVYLTPRPYAETLTGPLPERGSVGHAAPRPLLRNHPASVGSVLQEEQEAGINTNGRLFRLRDAPGSGAARAHPSGSGLVYRPVLRKKHVPTQEKPNGLFFRPLLRGQPALGSARDTARTEDDDEEEGGSGGDHGDGRTSSTRLLGAGGFAGGSGGRLRKAKPVQLVVQKHGGLPWRKALIRVCCLRKTRRRRVRSIVNLYRKMPLKAISRLWGRFNQIELPVFLRRPLLSLYIWMFGCRLDEAEIEDLRHYRNLGEFFRRELKPHVRPIDDDHVLTSPADGKILYYGKVENGILEQVKGVTYSLRGFLGPQTWHAAQAHDINHMSDFEYQQHLSVHPDNDLFHCIIYLAPGDYHRFHSPTHWVVNHRRHFPGELLSVNPGVARWIQGLFNFNERAVYTGKWEHGFFSMCAVGATNVGSIKIYCDDDLETNTHHKHQDGTYFDRTFSSAVDVAKGSMFGEFNLGSTLVLIFEAPKGFDFKIHEGQKVKYGEPLGTSP